jgi:two-component system cell cycle response regulator DivK
MSQATILVVEDNPWNAQLVSDMLGTMGYNIIEVNNGVRGIEIAQSQQPDLILLDVMLPDINGAEVARQLKSSDDTKHIPIVALTANASNAIYRECEEAGCDSFMTKPYTKNSLVSTIRQYLGDE